MRKLKNEELNRLTVEDFKQAEKKELVVVLDNVRSMNNVGAVFRTSDAFLIKKVYLCGITATPPHSEIQKTALGATESVEWAYVEETLEVIARLQQDDFKVYAIEQAAQSILLDEFKPGKNDKIAVVFGHEVRGVKQAVVDAADGCIEIPQFGTKHSLNISVCAGIVLWEVGKQLAARKA